MDMKATEASPTEGVLIVDKPFGWTSHDVIAKLRGILGLKRLGHTGTLDPGATGVLIVAVGRATRLIRFLDDLPKRYTGELVLGSTTTTLDDQGEINGTFDMSEVTLSQVKEVAERFVGRIDQVPPMVSALKVNGKRLHELARAGIEVERKARPVTVHSLEIAESSDSGVFTMRVECSSGTYIRTLADDIGRGLDGGAHLRRLRRTGIGLFLESEAVSLDALAQDWKPHLRPPSALVQHLPNVAVGSQAASAISHGQSLDPVIFPDDPEGPWAVVDKGGRLLAVYESRGDAMRPAVVLAAH